ncbi:MAG: hypothetical protein LUG64_02370 [Clostridiales bacterium]|nr:hypothetical protein [Clostridiales bacterium]
MDIQDYHAYFLSQNPDFDSLSDEEKNDCYFWAAILEESKKSGHKAKPLSKKRQEQMGYVGQLLTLIIKGKNLKFTAERRRPISGFIEINGDTISITKPAMFAQAMQVVTNLDVYPKTDGTVEFDLAFYNDEE